MLVSSEKTIVTTETPYFEIERISVTFGRPDIARSTGTVTYCSISTGESAGADVMICTCRLVTSGTASMGRRKAAPTPRTISNSVARRTIGRFRNDQRTMAERKCMSLLLAEGALQHGALEREDAVDDDALLVAKTRQD